VGRLRPGNQYSSSRKSSHNDHARFPMQVELRFRSGIELHEGFRANEAFFAPFKTELGQGNQRDFPFPVPSGKSGCPNINMATPRRARAMRFLQAPKISESLAILGDAQWDECYSFFTMGPIPRFLTGSGNRGRQAESRSPISCSG
jgi:hypothetical protein